ncbi:MAG: TRAP transporter substrate-binding protein DctP [Candidatus Eremiobacteraeota bacterium]|nr:TRAP transporter substrate-binding protein DctP [Candidatus Eremiobacteraeota bacterium]
MNPQELAHLADHMAGAIDHVRGMTGAIAVNARQQAASLRDVVETTQGAARELAATSAIVHAVRDDVSDARSAVTLASQQIADLSGTVDGLARHSRSAAGAIHELLEASTKISAAVKFVEDVSDQTNLLALNASIEAARAGVHGRGFGVVAHEMRKLAESTRTATTEMKALLRDIATKAGAATGVVSGTDAAVALGTSASALADQALASISSAVASVGGAFERVDDTIAGQASRVEELERASQSVLDISRSHHTAATESTLSVNALAHDIKRLQIAGTAAVVPLRGVLRVATILNDSPSAAAWSHFAALVEERTERRVRVELDIPYTGKGRGEVNAFDDLIGGELALASVGCSVSGNVIPSAQMFELPYLFESAEHAFAVLDSAAGQDVLAEAAGVGLLAYGYLENGMRHFTSAMQPIRTPDDVRGLRLRVMEAPVYLHFAAALGAVAITVPYFKLPDALETGEAQAQENPLTNIRGLDLARAQRYLSLTAHSFTPQIVFANPAAMEALGSDRAPVEMVLHETMAWHRGRAREMERDALGWLRARMDVIELDAGASEAFRAATAGVDEHIDRLVGVGRCARLRAAAASLRSGRGVYHARA